MSKRKIILLLFVLFNCDLFVNSASGLGTEEFGDKPIEISADWPAGTQAMVESPGRVYSRWVNGGECFCYKGDIKAFNDALKKFAAIEAPAHQLTIEWDYGKTKSFGGKEIWFDWRLDVIGGISRYVAREKGATEEELAPKLTYYLCRNEAKLDDLILPENIEAVLSDPKYNQSFGYRLKRALKWRTARRKWAEFADHFLEVQRKRLKESWPTGSEPPIAGYVEFQSRLVSKYLPDYKIYIIETSIISVSKLFAVSATGEIFDLKGYEFSGKNGCPFRNEPFSKFIAGQHIQVSDVNDAIETGKFVEELVFTPGRWMGLRHNSNNFKVFNAQMFSKYGTIEDPHWQWYAEKCDVGWLVSKRYVGPPASIAAPPRWTFVCDEKNQITDLHM